MSAILLRAELAKIINETAFKIVNRHLVSLVRRPVNDNESAA